MAGGAGPPGPLVPDLAAPARGAAGATCRAHPRTPTRPFRRSTASRPPCTGRPRKRHSSPTECDNAAGQRVKTEEAQSGIRRRTGSPV